jgi:L-threonylcarbamoyladenylate synthase
MRQQAEALAAAGKRVGILTVEEERAQFTGSPAQVLVLGSLADPEPVARGLFAAFRVLDAQGVNVILVRMLAEEGLGLAINDRLIRAAEGRVIQT